MTKKCDKDKDRGVALPKYMYRRDDGRSLNYYVRLVAPTEIQPYFDKKDLSFVNRRDRLTFAVRR